MLSLLIMKKIFVIFKKIVYWFKRYKVVLENLSNFKEKADYGRHKPDITINFFVKINVFTIKP